MSSKPIVICFSGHDPCGGAGIQADIETLYSLGCHAAGVITALTAQNTSNVYKLYPQDPVNIINQAKLIFDDMPISAIKIGLLGHHEVAYAIEEILTNHPTIPVIFDPVLAAGGGMELANDRLVETIVNQLLPKTSILTPNTLEARALTGLDAIDLAAQALVNYGVELVLITGTHEDTEAVNNQLYDESGLVESFQWGRLPHEYHGSGCTLATAIAGLTARGLDPFNVILEAQEFTWNALVAGYQPGKGQYVPNRLFWLEDQG